MHSGWIILAKVIMHFHDWIHNHGVAFLIELLETGHIMAILRSVVRFLPKNLRFSVLTSVCYGSGLTVCAFFRFFSICMVLGFSYRFPFDLSDN